MSGKKEKQVDLYSYRLTDTRKEKIEKLKGLEIFRNVKTTSQIFDHLINTAIEFPERFENSLIASEIDILSYVREIRESQQEFNKHLVTLLEMQYNSIRKIEKNLDIIKKEKNLSELSFSPKIERINQDFRKNDKNQL